LSTKEATCLPSSRIIFEDNHLLVVDKPAGVPSVPDESGDISLLDMCRQYIKEAYKKPGNVFLAVVHRLDRPVSGVICFAKRSKAASRLSDQMRRGAIKKEYLAVVKGAPQEPAGTVENFLIKDRKRNLVSIATRERHGAKRAVTGWKILESRGGLSLVRLLPETGRPHQIRVHMAALGCPILGDLRYGPGPPLEDASIALHAAGLGLTHPTKKTELSLSAPPPEAYPWNLFSTKG
jgi:23S rRNA pseudouridine1911/1915/1917 synthase